MRSMQTHFFSYRLQSETTTSQITLRVPYEKTKATVGIDQFPAPEEAQPTKPCSLPAYRALLIPSI
jgi:hypothetical protein